MVWLYCTSRSGKTFANKPDPLCHLWPFLPNVSMNKLLFKSTAWKLAVSGVSSTACLLYLVKYFFKTPLKEFIQVHSLCLNDSSFIYSHKSRI